MEITEQQAEDVRRAVSDFRRAMELRGELNLRVARRVTSILRVGMFSFAVVTVIMVGMLIAFTSRVGEMIVVLNTMQAQFSSMSHDMRRMSAVIGKMDQDMASLSTVSSELVNMRNNVSHMKSEMAGMTQAIGNVEGSLEVITTNVGQMNHSFREIEPALVGIGANLNKVSAPIKTFNNFMPW